MPRIKQDIYDRIIDRQNDDKVLLDIVGQYSELRKEGASYRTECPVCHSHSLIITPGKGFKCFACNEVKGRNAYHYLMAAGHKDSMDVIKELAAHLNIFIEYEEEPTRIKSKTKDKNDYWKRMLQASGLAKSDVTAKVRAEDGTTREEPTFFSGTMTPKGDITEGDDCVIAYYDLNGRPVTYISKYDKEERPREYYRVRYQNPDMHKDQKEGKSMKYRTPYGAPAFIYYPQKIRELYQKQMPIKRLFIQEGEKKAEKATKHGILSVAVSGIQNIASGGKLPEELISLVQVCKVEEVIFLLDSDCNDLSSSLTVNKPIDTRPRGFFNAVKNFKEYFDTLKNAGIYIEILYGHVMKNEAQDKGVDDLLSNTLKGKEDELLQDIESARNSKPMQGKWVYLRKITTLPDNKLLEDWHLHSAQEFAQAHYAELKDMPEFTFGRRKYRFNDNGEFESAQPVEADEKFWIESKKKEGTTECYFDYDGCKNFLEHRGYWRWETLNHEYEFVYVADNIVETVKPHQIADFVKAFAKDTLQKGVRQMLYKGTAQYFGQVSLSMLDYFTGKFDVPQRGIERLFFRNTIWEVNAGDIKEKSYTQLSYNIWASQKKDYEVSKLPELIRIRHEDDQWSYEITETGRKCDFLLFLENASNFTWRKSEPTQQDKLENAQHFISKLSAFGYLVTSMKDKSICKAVIGMDGKQSEVGVSNGRSGKSLLGEACRVVVNTLYKNGKEFRGGPLQPFVWDGLDNRTRLVFLDDTPKDFDFEGFFPLVSGDWPVNPKGHSPFTIAWADSPKIYQATNHANSGDGDSYEDRQWLIAFSDFYNAKHKPIQDFGRHFFSDEWDEHDWNLFWNLVATAIQVYFRFGYIPAPGDRLEKRKLTQEVGEEFILWADEYFSPSTDPSKPSRLNQVDIPRKDMYDNFLEYIGPSRRTYYQPRTFKTKLIKYCELKGYIFNPQIFDPEKNEYIKIKDGIIDRSIKRNGCEFFTIGTREFYSCRQTQYSSTGTVIPPIPEVDITDLDTLNLLDIEQ
jgi:hypothetical protein